MSAAAPAGALAPTPRPAEARTRLLLVEDSPTQALQLRRMLEAQGFEVAHAVTAEAALEALNGPLPGLVIADYHLPGMNGDELTRQIRLNVRTRAIPVLMLTEAQGRVPGLDLERQGLESGADAYAPKSADPDLLLMRLRALLRREEGAAPAALDPLGGAFRRARLLVVDEGATHRLWLAGLFAQDGYAVETLGVPDAAEARRAVRAGCDCVVVNLEGAGFDGAALCRRLDALRGERAEGEPHVFRIVGLGTDRPDAKARIAEFFEAGVDDLLPAGAGADAIRVRVRAVVRRKLLQDESRRFAAELRERERDMERARAEAAAAEALAAANAELEEANRRLRDTQGKLVQAAKMASLGELVAGIAHEINNPLAFILGHQATVERLLAQAGPMVEGGPAAPLVAKARARADSMTLGLRRIEELVRNLRKFSRLDDGGRRRVDVPEAIGTVLALLNHKLGDRIVVERRLSAPEALDCSPALLNQVVMNVIGNAADALNEHCPAGGTIRVSSACDGRDYVIEVEDSGPGVPESLRERIFEPFFTTKAVGSGTGLGLAIAYNVVRAHDGNIGVGASALGGARFTVSVPFADRAGERVDGTEGP